MAKKFNEAVTSTFSYIGTVSGGQSGTVIRMLVKEADIKPKNKTMININLPLESSNPMASAFNLKTIDTEISVTAFIEYSKLDVLYDTFYQSTSETYLGLPTDPSTIHNDTGQRREWSGWIKTNSLKRTPKRYKVVDTAVDTSGTGAIIDVVEIQFTWLVGVELGGD